jgi:hypothetical protein
MPRHGLAVIHTPKTSFLVPPVQIKPATLDSSPSRKHGEDFPAPTAPSADKAPPVEIVMPLAVPKALHCDFCVRFASTCSKCHFKWAKETSKRRSAALISIIASQPDPVRVAIFFASVARGDVSFVQCFLDVHRRAFDWYSEFKALPADPCSPLLASSGKLFGLHVAFAFRRPEMAKVLLDAGAFFRRSESGHTPLQYLDAPLQGEWADMLAGQALYQEHLLTDRAKEERSMRCYATADAIYAEVLEMNARNEHAICGRAKMAFDQERFGECAARCRDILALPRDGVLWMEFSRATIEVLLEHSVRRHHEVSHAVAGAVRKACGCILTNSVRLRLRRLKFSIIQAHVIPFLDGTGSFAVWQAIGRMPVIHNALTQHIAAMPKPMIRTIIMSQPAISQRLVDALRRDTPAEDRRVAAPVRFYGFEVSVVADFLVFLLTVYAEGANPKKQKEGFFKKKSDAPATVFLCKKYQISRRNIDEPWTLNEAGDWEDAARPT